jgi:hypothetical protein
VNIAALPYNAGSRTLMCVLDLCGPSALRRTRAADLHLRYCERGLGDGDIIHRIPTPAWIIDLKETPGPT